MHMKINQAGSQKRHTNHPQIDLNKTLHREIIRALTRNDRNTNDGVFSYFFNARKDVPGHLPACVATRTLTTSSNDLPDWLKLKPSSPPQAKIAQKERRLYKSSSEEYFPLENVCAHAVERDDVNIPKTAGLFLDGKFECLLSEDTSKQLLGQNPDGQQHLDTCIVKNVETFLASTSGDGSLDRELEVLLCGASCLQLFVQNNWLGPLTDTPPTAFLTQPWTDDKAVQEIALSSLSEDGEPVYNLSRHTGFLHLARIIFVDCRHLCTSLQTWDWWLVRCLAVQQALLEQRSPTLRATILERLEDLSKRESLLIRESNKDVAVLFHLEAARMCQMYWEDKAALDHVTQARKLAGLEVELTGALGKRTRFQQEHTAQLLVKVTRDQGEQSLPAVGLCDPEFSATVPKNVALDDDTVLNKVNFKDEEANKVTPLSPLEQALLYGVMDCHRRTVAEEKLRDEEVVTYLEHILSQSSNWCVSVSALTLRSKLESDSRRRVERSMQQIEELVNQVSSKEPGVADRLPLFYPARPPTTWVLQSELASLLISLGCIGAALDIYERLQLWEDAIACYQRLGKREKAESVIREQLAIKETPSLLCFLGDVTHDKTHYQRAWEMSNQRSARAMRCLGYIHFSEERYDEAVECFEKSLAINALQIPVWFTCGCACMAAGNYEAAVKAFRRCVNIDYDNFEAWSNLATAYARLKNKRKAFLTVKDAIKCNYDNWRLWENCLVFATDCGEFRDVIQAYHRLMDLKEKWTDAEVLKIVVKAVTNNMEDAAGLPAARLHGKLLELFGRITAKVTSDAQIWRLYADLTLAETEHHKPDMQKAVQFLQKSHRCVMQTSAWEKDDKKCKEVAEQSLELSEVYQSCASQTENSQQAIQMLSSAKLMLKGVATKIRQQHTDPVNKTLPEVMSELCESLDKELESVTNRVAELRTGQ
ncbi:hypothetical protein BaRGS_00031287 [Batillaria attramentaria]|uniref:Tetratricopeptide repeat protein 27 n=1 Tax=Batillaria attramentaria TaxID=370345 RepID=A0ABD0JSB2_9CAEN